MTSISKKLIKIGIMSLVLLLWGSVYVSTGKTDETLQLDVSKVYVADDTIYCANGKDLVMISPANNIGPWSATVVTLTGDVGSIMKEGNKIYAGVKDTGLCILEENTDGSLKSPVYLNVTKYFPPHFLNVRINLPPSVYIADDYAYLGYEGMGLAIVNMGDLTNPDEPVIMHESQEVFNIFVSEDCVFLAERFKLIIMDITDPMNPGQPIHVDTASETMDVWVVNDYAYIADFYWGLAIVDVSDPTNPGESIEKETGGQTRSICVNGGYAYLIDGNNGLVIIDISDPTNPGDPILEYNENNWQDVHVNGNYAYIAALSDGLAIIDVSDPTNPSEEIFITNIEQPTYFTEQGTNINLWKAPETGNQEQPPNFLENFGLTPFPSVVVLPGFIYLYFKKRRR
jgi:hypothetical protein